MNIPKELKYSKDHEWVKVEGNIATIGITDFAQSQLGDVVFVDLPAEGASIEQGKEFAVVESVKAVSDIYAPVSGVIKKVNTQLADAPETLNQDAYGEGWIVVVEMSAPAQTNELLDSAAYGELCEKEGH